MRRRRARLLCALVAALVASALPRGAEAFGLEGAWFLLMHYRDDSSHDPKQLRWEDRIWVFERKGDALAWTEYPIVVFQDETGRFERLGGNRAARVVGAWEPNSVQLSQIRDGLEYNTRGAKSKTLRGSDNAGWRSSGGEAPTSASVITYSETWIVESPSGNPVFTRVDVLGAASARSMEGRTEYRTERIDADGTVLHGRFERDGVRHGTFRMMRSGSAAIVKGSGKTNEERVREMFMSSVGPGFFADPKLKKEWERSAESGEIPEALRERIRRDIRRSVEERVRAEGASPHALEPQIDRLTREIERLLLEERRSPEEIERMIQEGRVLP